MNKKKWDKQIKGPLLYCFSSIYDRSRIYTNMYLKCLAPNTKQIIAASHNPLCFSPVSKVLKGGVVTLVGDNTTHSRTFLCGCFCSDE